MNITGYRGSVLQANCFSSKPAVNNAEANNTTSLLKKNEFDTVSFSGNPVAKAVKPKKNVINVLGDFVKAVFKGISKMWSNYCKKEYEVLYKKGPFIA